MTSETNFGENKNIDNNNNDNKVENFVSPYETESEREINLGNIDRNAYFLSLTDKAFETGLLTEKDITDMQAHIYDLLSDNIWMYTNGTSSSVTSKEANEILMSVLKVLDSYCLSEIKNGVKPVDLVMILKEKAGIKKCYEKGLEILGKKSAKEIAVEKITGEVIETVKSYENLYEDDIDGDEYYALEKELGMGMESENIKNKILSQDALTDVEFNILCSNVTKCKTAEKKADLIIKSISAAGDFLDILNAQCLFGDEYLVLYKKLLKESPETIEFLRDSLEDDDNLDDNDEEWQIFLTEFFGG